MKELDKSTEEKIKSAARTVFHRKGYAATRTRDIAEEADINLALLNYYFRSKEKLFEIIMLETLKEFMGKMTQVFNDENTSLINKVELMTDKYVDMILEEPDIPLFIMSEIRDHTKSFLEKMPVDEMLGKSVMMQQYRQAFKEGKVTEPNPLHFLMNVLGLIIFPFISSPLVRKMGNMQGDDFKNIMLERKRLIPVWVQSMFMTESK